MIPLARESFNEHSEDAEFEQYQTDTESDQPGSWGPTRSIVFKAHRWAQRLLRPPTTAAARGWTQLRPMSP